MERFSTILSRTFPARDHRAISLLWILFPAFLLLSPPIARAGDLPVTDTRQFLARFWQRPLAKQTSAQIFPQRICRPLAVETCGCCHEAQHRDWSGSRHALALGPGAIGQFYGMEEEQWQSCLDCHAPLREQSLSLARYLEESSGEPETGEAIPNAVDGEPRSQPQSVHRPLHRQGVSCPVCHVRDGRWYGPPRREGLLPLAAAENLPHRGWLSAEAFGDSRFCAACHQFPPGGHSLRGKPLENTYQEWRASPQARRGIHCQGCHMPDRRHRFRGIHDLGTVRAGSEAGSSGFSVSEGRINVRVTLTNTGTGHLLPTYATPEIRLEAWQEDRSGNPIPGTEAVQWVARRVDLQITTEHFDTRLAPGQSMTLVYQKPRSPQANRLLTRIRVEPDAFYTRIYRALLEMELEDPGARWIRRALAESQQSAFTLYQKHYSLPEK